MKNLMADSEKRFHKIIAQLPNGVEGNFFAAKCIKSTNDKTAAFFWKGDMTFKLDEETQSEALKIEGAKIGSHLYAADKLMRGWILIPKKSSEKWIKFAKKAVDYVGK